MKKVDTKKTYITEINHIPVFTKNSFPNPCCNNWVSQSFAGIAQKGVRRPKTILSFSMLKARKKPSIWPQIDLPKPKWAHIVHQNPDGAQLSIKPWMLLNFK